MSDPALNPIQVTDMEWMALLLMAGTDYRPEGWVYDPEVRCEATDLDGTGETVRCEETKYHIGGHTVWHEKDGERRIWSQWGYAQGLFHARWHLHALIERNIDEDS